MKRLSGLHFVTPLKVTVSVLDAIGELASIGGSEIVRHVDELFPKLVGYITDSTSLKRREV